MCMCVIKWVKLEKVFILIKLLRLIFMFKLIFIIIFIFIRYLLSYSYSYLSDIKSYICPGTIYICPGANPHNPHVPGPPLLPCCQRRTNVQSVAPIQIFFGSSKIQINRRRQRPNLFETGELCNSYIHRTDESRP